jgi:hypothetical protein
MRVREEADHRRVLDGDETGLPPDRGGAVAATLLEREVIREARDDPVARSRLPDRALER